MQKSNERDESTPVIVGTAQLVQREVDPAESEDPIRMVARLARQAAEDAGGGGDLLRDLDTIGLVNLGGDVKNPARLVAECLGVHPATEIVTEMGGQIGLTLANHAAGRIAAGESRVALVGSSSLLRTLRKARQLGIELERSATDSGARPTSIRSSRTRSARPVGSRSTTTTSESARSSAASPKSRRRIPTPGFPGFEVPRRSSPRRPRTG
jgi:acetyl-CoA C-acetyltransferase